MLLKFSTETAELLKNQIPRIGQLTWTHENELDLTYIKQLKGCRTQLVQDCLRVIQKLDSLVIMDSIHHDEREAFTNNSSGLPIGDLIEGLKKYLENCERYPRIKNFLNIIPDNTSGMVSFAIILSTFITFTSQSPLLAIIPVSILIWVLIDLIFNNRTAVKNLRILLFNAEDELSPFIKVGNILSRNRQPSETHSTTSLVAPSIPSTSRDYGSFEETSLSSCHFFQAEVHADATNSSNNSDFSLT